MKIGKKLTFLGLAVLGTVSLASCDLAKYISDFANGVTGERSLEYTQVIPSSNQPSATVPSQITSTTTNKYNPTTTTTTNRYSTTSTNQKYYIKYQSYVDGMLNSNLMNNSDYTYDGYVKYPGYYTYPSYEFYGYYEDIYGKTPFDFNQRIYSDKNLYAIYRYQTSTTFYKQTSDSTNFFTQSKMKGFYFTEGSTFNNYSPSLMVGSYNGVSVDDRGLYLYGTNAYADFGQTYKSKRGTYDIVFDVTYESVQNETFFSILGNSTKIVNGEVFGLSVSNNKLYYTVDGGPNNNINKTGGISIVPYATYSFHIYIDTNKEYIFVDTINGDYILDLSTSISSIYGLKFTSKSTGTTSKTINNIAVNYYNYY